MRTTDEHAHVSRVVSGEATGICALCGQEICSFQSPISHKGCTLTKGHEGPHKNEFTDGDFDEPVSGGM